MKKFRLYILLLWPFLSYSQTTIHQDTVTFDKSIYNSEDLIRNKFIGDSIFYNYPDNTTYKFKKFNYQKYAPYECAVIETPVAKMIEDGKLSATEIQNEFNYNLNNNQTQPESKESIIHHYFSHAIFQNFCNISGPPPPFLPCIHDSFTLYYFGSPVSILLCKQKAPVYDSIARFVYNKSISGKLPELSKNLYDPDTFTLPSILKNSLGLSSQFNDTFGLPFSPDIISQIKLNQPSLMFFSHSRYVNLIPKKITYSNYLQHQIIYISSGKGIAMASHKYARIKNAIQKNPELFDHYLDSTDFCFSENCRDTFKSFGHLLLAGYLEAGAALKAGEIGYSGHTDMGFYIIRAAKDPMKKEETLWCMPEFFIRK